MWLVDPETREPLPAFVAVVLPLWSIGRDHTWPGIHSAVWPGYEESTPDSLGVEYVRKCRRECCTALSTASQTPPDDLPRT